MSATGTLTRAEQAEQTRRLVLETAQRLFRDRGYDATSLQLIADEMGVAKANVYYYFKTKVELLDAVMAPSMERLTSLLAAAALVRGKRERVKMIVDGYVDLLVANRGMIAMASSDPALRRQKSPDDPGIKARALAEQLFFGAHPTPDERLAMELVLALQEYVGELGDLSDDELRATLTRTCLRLLQAR